MLYLIYIGVAIVFSFIAIYKLKVKKERDAKELRCSSLVKGKVVDLMFVSEHEYVPVIKYLVKGKEYSGEAACRVNPKAFFIGKEVEINYNELDPEEFYMQEEKEPDKTFTFIKIAFVVFVFSVFAIIVIGFR